MVRRGKARELCGTIAGLPWHHEIEREGEKDKERDRHGQGKRVRGGRERKSTRVREREEGIGLLHWGPCVGLWESRGIIMRDGGGGDTRQGKEDGESSLRSHKKY